MAYALIAGIFAVVCLLVLLVIPRRRPRNHLDVTAEPLGRVAIQEALEGFMADNHLAGPMSPNVGGPDEYGRRLNELRDLISALARNQKSEADIFVIVIRSFATLVGIVSVTIAAIALVVNLIR